MSWPSILCGIILILAIDAYSLTYKYRSPSGTLLLTNRPVHKKGYVLLGTIGRRSGKSSRVSKAEQKRYFSLAKSAAKELGADQKLVLAIIKAESDFNPRAMSRAGAYGLMQLMPITARHMGVNRNDPWQNLIGGIRYMQQLLKQFKGDMSLMLAAYNAGPEAVTSRNNTVPPYKETKNYIKKVLKFYHSGVRL